MEVTDHLLVIRGRWPIVVAAAVVAAVVAWWTAPAQTPAQSPSGPEQVQVESYTATHTLIQDRDPGARSQTATLNVTLLTALAQRGDIPRRVVERLGLNEEPAVVAARVQITEDSKLGMITITASGADGDQAATLANAFGEEILAYAGESAESLRQENVEFTRSLAASQRQRIEELNAALQQLPQESDDARLVAVERDAVLAAYGRSLSRLEELSTGAASPGLVTLSEAVPVPVSSGSGGGPVQVPRDPSTRLGLAVLVGALLGGGLALLLERVDPRVRSRRQAEEAFGLPVIADVQGSSRIAGVLSRWFARTGRLPPAAGTGGVPYERLRLDVQRRPRWVLPPPSPDAAALDAGAVQPSALAVHDPVRVVLVTSPVEGEGRTEVLEQLAASFRAAGYQVALMVGRGADPRSAERIRAARDQADVVLVDGGALLLASDAAAAISEVDAVVAVARLDRTSMADAALAREELAALQAPVLGVVLTGTRAGTVLRTIGQGRRRAGARWVARSTPDLEPEPSRATAAGAHRGGEGSRSGASPGLTVDPPIAGTTSPHGPERPENGLLPRAWLMEVYENLRTETRLEPSSEDPLTVDLRGAPNHHRHLPPFDGGDVVDGRHPDGDQHGADRRGEQGEHETEEAAPWRMRG